MKNFFFNKIDFALWMQWYKNQLVMCGGENLFFFVG